MKHLTHWLSILAFTVCTVALAGLGGCSEESSLEGDLDGVDTSAPTAPTPDGTTPPPPPAPDTTTPADTSDAADTGM